MKSAIRKGWIDGLPSDGRSEARADHVLAFPVIVGVFKLVSIVTGWARLVTVYGDHLSYANLQGSRPAQNVNLKLLN